jgi:hypothetical protein
MRRSSAASARRRGPTARRGAAGTKRGERRDWWAVSVTAAFVISAALWLRATVLPNDPVAWSHQAVLLCLVVASAAGRALLGFRPRPPATAAEGAGRAARALWFAIPIAAIVPYARTLGVGFLSDDFGLVLPAGGSGPWHALSAVPGSAFYRPTSALLWWAGARLWGAGPVGYHLLNLAVHAANALLVAVVGARIMGSRYGGALAGLLFAVHPLHVEPVVWMSCLPDLLCTGFSLVSLLLLEIHIAAPSWGARGGSLAGALAAFVLALLSKEAALALPGIVVLRLAIASVSRRRLAAVGGAYAAVLMGYLALRLSLLGHLGGYQVRLTFWHGIFPSAPLQEIGHFLMPIHWHLVASAPAVWLTVLVLALFGASALWWVRGLPGVPARRLWLWGGYVLVASAPVWVLASGALWDLEGSRLHYLPTVGLAWLFGDLCAGRGGGWRRSGAAAGAIVLGAAAVCGWYATPWQEAGEMGRRVLSEGRSLVAHLPKTDRAATLFVLDLPDGHDGAQVFRNSFPEALEHSLTQDLRVYVVTREELARSPLGAGEYAAAWDSKASRFELLGAGGQPAAAPGIGEQP